MSEAAETMIRCLRSLADFPDDEAEVLRRHTVTRRIDRGGFYLVAGSITDRFAFVTQGLFRFSYSDENGKDYTAFFAGEGCFIPSFASVSMGIASRFSVEALEESEVAELPFRKLKELEEFSPAARKITRQFLLKALLAKEKREASLILDDAETRYRDFLEEFAPLENRLRLHHIASYLGISPVSLSRIRKKMGRI
jgi:CRP-like cAMP-binding protein